MKTPVEISIEIIYFISVFLGKFILFEDCLNPLKSISIVEAQQIIHIMEHLYNCSILHRNIHPENLMYDGKTRHTKLIGFHFATKFEIDEKKKELNIQGVISFANLKLLEIYLEALQRKIYCSYEYEKSFDLVCAINVIMFLKDNKITDDLNYLKDFSTEHKFHLMQHIWRNLKKTNKNYNDMLNVANNLCSAKDFMTIKHIMEQSFE